MRRQNYYRPDGNDYSSREAYRRREASEPDRPVYNNYGGQPYYPPRRHHWFVWIVVIILCIGLGWFAADHYLGNPGQSSSPQTTVNRKTVVNKTAPASRSNSNQTPQQPNVGKLDKEMDQLDVNAKDQETAVNFYQKQSPKNQVKMDKMISLVNKVVPSNTLKRQALSWILR